ncbi:NERD domain-containing protein [Streptococcus pneumoniae]|nr:NERD domain-containing protein [Streptococcus pneumoniae]
MAGYRAHEGEIDRILVGPNGVFAFEVKNLGGVSPLRRRSLVAVTRRIDRAFEPRRTPACRSGPQAASLRGSDPQTQSHSGRVDGRGSQDQVGNRRGVQIG